jgi:hypothetical protein
MLPPSSWSLLNGSSARPARKIYDIPPVVRREPRRLWLRRHRPRRRSGT